MSKLLEGITILDFSHRLPGPLAGKVLADLGADVIKIEDEKYKDAFLMGLFSDFDESFTRWYENLNHMKKVVRLNFKSETLAEDLRPYLEKASGIIMGLPPKIRVAAKLTDEDLKNLGKPMAKIEMLASREINSAMHDLNALASSGLLKMFLEGRDENIVNPPFLPIMGISFGQYIATSLLAAVLKSQKENGFVTENTYLFDDILAIMSSFWPEQDRKEGRTKFLHNGAYPCYNLYKLKDGNYAALAAVEDKFWDRFIEIFDLDLPDAQRFRTDDEALNMVSAVFQNIDTQKLNDIIKDNDICLSLVEK